MAWGSAQKTSEALATRTAMEAKGQHMWHPQQGKHCERKRKRLEAEKRRNWMPRLCLEALQRCIARHQRMESPSNGCLISAKIHRTAQKNCQICSKITQLKCPTWSLLSINVPLTVTCKSSSGDAVADM